MHKKFQYHLKDDKCKVGIVPWVLQRHTKGVLQFFSVCMSICAFVLAEEGSKRFYKLNLKDSKI